MRILEITAYTAGALFVAVVLAATIYITAGILVQALADWSRDAADWFRRHGV